MRSRHSKRFRQQTNFRDITQIYLREINQHKLLEAEEEHRLALRVSKGDRRAAQKMIESNLRLVVKLARRYLHRGLPLSDLIEEGNLGLIRAVGKFDPERGFRFSTYATWWIRQAIEQAVMGQPRIIRLPMHLLRKVRAEFKKGKAVQGTSPPPLDLEEVEKEELFNGYRTTLLGPQKAANLPHITFLDQTTLEELPDLSQEEPLQGLEQEDLKEYLGYWLKQLPSNYQEVIGRRFGLLGYEASTLEEVGVVLGITPDRVQQIQLAAIKRLKKVLKKEGYS